MTVCLVMLFMSSAMADEQPFVQTYSNDDNITFGLEIKGGEKLTKPIFKKPHRVSQHSLLAATNSLLSRFKSGLLHAANHFFCYLCEFNPHDYMIISHQ